MKPINHQKNNLAPLGITPVRIMWIVAITFFFLFGSAKNSAAQSTEDSIPSTTLASILDQTHIGGYGEITYKRPAEGDVPRLNIPRFVIYLDHYFSEKWAMKSEAEIEDIKIERGEGGEIGLEQAYLDFHANQHIGWRGGLLLIPMGIINQTHEPNTFYSVERPLLDQVVIPTTWREIGTGIYGDISEGIKYQLYITEGLKGNNISAEGFDEGKQEGSAGEATSDAIAGSDASHPAFSAKLDFLPVTGLRVGAAAYVQPNAFQYPSYAPSSDSKMLAMIGLDARYSTGPLRLRGEGVFVSTGDASQNIGVPKNIKGGYLEGAYNLMPVICSSSRAELLPFVRYEAFSFDALTNANDTTGIFATSTTEKHTAVTAGVACKPLENLILKVDYRWVTPQGEATEKQFSLGAGFAF